MTLSKQRELIQDLKNIKKRQNNPHNALQINHVPKFNCMKIF